MLTGVSARRAAERAIALLRAGPRDPNFESRPARSSRSVYVLEKQGGQTLTMGDALGELLAVITEAARTGAMILQQVGNGPPPRTATGR
jgi:hypothetical protein